MSHCPICDKKTDPEYKPFCSKRCADIDLGRWFSESYRVPSEEEAEVDAGPSDKLKLH